MGEWNRELVYRHHDVSSHAAELVRLWRTSGPRPAPGPADELARMARMQGQLESKAVLFEMEAALSRAERDRVRAELAFLKGTRRYRLAAALARPLDLVRRLRRRRGGASARRG
jgi:hypothetical protein